MPTLYTFEIVLLIMGHGSNAHGSFAHGKFEDPVMAVMDIEPMTYSLDLCFQLSSATVLISVSSPNICRFDSPKHP